MTLRLTRNDRLFRSLDLRHFAPEKALNQSLDQVRATRVLAGNQPMKLGDYFELTDDLKDSCDPAVEFFGDLSNVHYLGYRMKACGVRIHGSCGNAVGQQMSSGAIHVHGNVGEECGVEMSGGKILIHGNAGNDLGGCRLGANVGMNRGIIAVGGNAGHRVGQRMRRGTILVSGSAEKLTGWEMIAGTIVVGEGVSAGAGLEMKRGTIIVCDGNPAKISRLAIPNGDTSTPVIRLMERWLKRELNASTIEVPPELNDGHIFVKQIGDINHGSRGEVLTPRPEPL